MVRTDRDISYTYDTQNERNRLDVYYSKTNSLRDVLVFVHGGAWESGSKDTYKYLGQNFVRKGLVTVIINYSLSPNLIGRMAQDCTAAVVWVQRNIFNYGGNPNRIFLMGHSSGGHLIELINSDTRFFRQYGIKNPIHGIILLDAFGLDMYEYLSQASPENDKYYNTFIQVFSNDPRNWKRASPMRYWKNIRNPHLILIGERTYSTIQTQNRDLFGKLISSRQAPVELYQIPRRNHTGMVAYMFFSGNEQYDIILNFMRRN
jgi:acetyl esterase/lipase